ncbi:substrate-binding domain-containing protein [Halanaerobium saccharolyticum]|uniref:substrate-binding domain-containing protein n=1 Tax=Halanaerobium saccharolyticum TaxID=43595 RepID=UPI001AB01E7A|nr:substrate-binding domain-containing protein [Halanaerobium saccharolyticum]
MTRYKESLELDHKIFDLYEEGLGIVYIDRINKYNSEAIATVLSDRKAGSQMMVNKFITMGHKKIAYVGNIESERFMGYKKAFQENNFKLQDDFIYNTGWNDGYRVGTIAAKKIIKAEKRPTGVVCFNDQVAVGLVQCLQKNDIKVPAEISVSGFDNIEISEYFSPALTTVDIPKRTLARKAVELFVEMIKNKNTADQKRQFIYPVELKYRDSIRKIKQ